MTRNRLKSNGKGIQNRLAEPLESTFPLACFPAFLPDFLGQSHGGVLQFGLRNLIQSAVEAFTVNVGLEEVAKYHFKDRPRDLLKQRLLPDRVRKELPAALRLHDPQDKDSGRGSTKRLVGYFGEFHELKTRVRDEWSEITPTTGREIQQGDKPVRGPPGGFALGEHHRNHDGERFTRLFLQA